MEPGRCFGSLSASKGHEHGRPAGDHCQGERLDEEVEEGVAAELVDDFDGIEVVGEEDAWGQGARRGGVRYQRRSCRRLGAALNRQEGPGFGFYGLCA